MLVVDASCVYETAVNESGAASVRAALSTDLDWAAPHCMTAEVLTVVRRQLRLGALDETRAALAIHDVALWPGRLFGHNLLLTRAWELRSFIASWDALYVALAEILSCPLVTLDRRLAAVAPCEVLIP